MNWEAIGAVGEAVGAVAVIITLVYLAIQVRQNTAIQRSVALQNLMEASAGFMDLCASDPKVARVFIDGLDAPESLSEVDRYQFGFLMMAWLRRVESVHGRVEIAEVSETEWAGMKASSTNLMARPGFRAWWQENHQRFRPSFALWVTGVAGATEP